MGKINMTFKEFKNNIIAEYKSIFPNSSVEVTMLKLLSCRSIMIKCHFAGNEVECPRGYFENDMFHITFDIALPDKFDGDILPENLTMKALSKSIVVKARDPIYWCDYSSIPYRQVKGGADKICNGFKMFVENLYSTLRSEMEKGNIHNNFINTVKSKII